MVREKTCRTWLALVPACGDSQNEQQERDPAESATVFSGEKNNSEKNNTDLLTKLEVRSLGLS